MSIVQHLRQAQGKRTDRATQIKSAAGRIGCEVNVLHAILDVESGGEPFDAQGRLIILPERHVFWRELPKSKRARAMTMGLASPKWSKANYAGLGGAGSDQRWDRLEQMAALDERAALMSVSFGSAQIMGFNHKICGFDSVIAFVQAMAASEASQIDAFLTFLLRSGLAEALRTKDFRAVARRYNGPGQVDYYAGRMVAAYNELCAAAGASEPASEAPSSLSLGTDGYRVKALQSRLSELGFVVRADGDFGPATRRAVVSFQVEHGLKADGIVGPKTEEMLAKASGLVEPNAERQGLTVQDLRRQGSQTVRKADWLSRIGMALTGTGAAAGGLESGERGFLSDLAGQVSGGIDLIRSIRADVQPLLDLVTGNTWTVFALTGLAVIVIAWQIKRRRLEDAKTWRHVG